MADDFFRPKKSFIFPIYISKKEAEAIPEKKTLHESLIAPKSVRKLIPRQCTCGWCDGMWFVPGKWVENEDSTRAVGHSGTCIKELAKAVKEKYLKKLEECPFTWEALRQAKRETTITFKQLSKLTGETESYITKKLFFNRIPKIETQVKFLKIFPNMKLKDGFNREEFLAKHDKSDDKKDKE
jgi:hypothetical protein